MPPFNASHSHLAHNATFNASVPTNTTCSDASLTHGVSWQSAYWSVMACSLAVLLQETGKVVNAPYRISYALRASPLICAIDTFLMLVKFVVLMAVGCSPRTAVKHVWYDRFVEDEDIGDASWVVWVWRDFARTKDQSSTTAVDASSMAAPQDNVPPVDGEAQGTFLAALSSHDNEESRLAYMQNPTTITPSGTVEHASIVHHEQSPNNATGEASPTVGPSLDRPSPSKESVTYMKDLPGCAVDRSWRLSMVSFIFGALPQAVKVFAMKGIPVTQIVVAFLLSSFVTAEVFRSVAGPVGLSNLCHSPGVLRCKRILASTHFTHLAFIACYLYLILFSFVMVLLTVPGPAGSIRNGVFACSILSCFAVTSWVSNRTVDLLEHYVFSEAFTAYVRSRSLYISRNKPFDRFRAKLLLLVPNALMLGPSRVESYATWMVVFPGFFAGVAWVYWRLSSLMVNFSWGTFAIVMSPAWMITPAYTLILAHFLYQLIFASSLADPIRYICGVQGTLDEFATGTFLIFNLGLTLYMYSVVSGFDNDLTFKPDWTEMLG